MKENALINGIENSTEIKQYKDSNVLLVHNYLIEYPSLLSGVLFQCCDFFYKQTVQLGKVVTNQVTMNLIELSPINEFRHKRQVATGRKFKIIRSFVLSFRK